MEQNPYSAPQTTLDYIEKRPLKQRIKRVLLSAFGQVGDLFFSSIALTLQYIS